MSILTSLFPSLLQLCNMSCPERKDEIQHFPIINFCLSLCWNVWPKVQQTVNVNNVKDIRFNLPALFLSPVAPGIVDASQCPLWYSPGSLCSSVVINRVADLLLVHGFRKIYEQLWSNCAERNQPPVQIRQLPLWGFLLHPPTDMCNHGCGCVCVFLTNNDCGQNFTREKVFLTRIHFDWGERKKKKNIQQLFNII